MKHLTLIIMAVFSISGCDNAQHIDTKLLQNDTTQRSLKLVISPGYKVKVGGVVVPISGSDDCFQTGMNVETLGVNRGGNRRSCIVITSETLKVPVQIESANGTLHEYWSVVHSVDTTVLQRADGSYIESVH